MLLQHVDNMHNNKRTACKVSASTSCSTHTYRVAEVLGERETTQQRVANCHTSSIGCQKHSTALVLQHTNQHQQQAS